MMQKPEAMELYPAEIGNGFSYLIYFDDGIKMDLTLYPLEDLHNYFDQSDGLVELLCDKDQRIHDAIEPTDQAYWLMKPSSRMFDDCCNEFWCLASYVAKGLYRQEIFFALDHLNQLLRPELLRMISWRIGAEKGFTFSIGKHRKFLDKQLHKDELQKLLETYNCGGIKETWMAFERCCTLFRSYSSQVAASFNYQYPDYDKEMTAFIYESYASLAKRADGGVED
ncbi:aminoglycoside 6-adenylyltransferase [Alkalihalobacillus xiaoxiensis]|uniref:Aminoglycoside 6-adenylyltransferase n=1 Tax=Shouchella xiaoxiensis TaxID=766895 RepID=A0ABS2SZ59_9BACI|nr:aminoglycoside 6-adenylyltransferase [Shouchella xiaoxiensis]